MPKILKSLIKNLVGPLGILALGAVIGLSFIIFKASAPKLPPQEKIWPIEAVEVSPQSHQPEILLHGRVESRQTTTLKGAVTAYVESTPALEGQKVTKDQLLIQLDPIDAKLILEQREAEVKRIESELIAEKNRKLTDEKSFELESELVELLTKSVSREQKLSKQSLASQARVEEAELAAVREKITIANRELALKNYQARLKQLEANLARASADRNLAKLNVSRTKVIAPFNGIISKRFVSVGDRVGANESIIQMYSTDALEIRAQITTDRIPDIQQALESNFKLKGELQGIDLDLNVNLDRLAGEIELDEGGIDALFKIEDKDPPLRIGEAVLLKLFLPAQDNLLKLPGTSLFETQDKHFIYLVVEQADGLRLKALEVDLVGVNFKGNHTQILVQTDINEPISVLSTRLPYARDGLKVELRGT